MSLKDGIISAPVSIDDVKSILGESSNDLATLCKSASINMWAKYKPVDSNNVFLDIKNGWKGKQNDCNISYPKTSNLSSVKDFYSQDNNGYSYRQVSAPYRLGDFLGYNHNAKSEFMNFGATTPVAEDSVSVSAAYNVNTVDSDWISMNNLLDDGNDTFHFGVLLYNNNGNKLQYFRTSKSSIIKFTKVLSGTYTIYPFMSSVDYSGSDFPTMQAGTYVPVPVLKPIIIVVKTKTEILGNKVTLTQTSTGTAILKNTEKSTSHIVSVQLRFSSSKENSAFVVGESTLISNLTLKAGASETILFSNKMMSGKSYSLWLFVDYTLVQKQLVFVDDSSIIG